MQTRPLASWIAGAIFWSTAACGNDSGAVSCPAGTLQVDGVCIANGPLQQDPRHTQVEDSPRVDGGDANGSSVHHGPGVVVPGAADAGSAGSADAGPKLTDAGTGLPPAMDAGHPNIDAGMDSGPNHASDGGVAATDAGQTVSGDAGVEAGSAATVDAGRAGSDAGKPDAGPPDAGPPDAGKVDCTQVVEQCNGADDNCNGIVDEGSRSIPSLYSSLFSAKLWPQGTFRAPAMVEGQHGLGQLLPRAGGGAMSLYKALSTSDGASSIVFTGLDARGGQLNYTAYCRFGCWEQSLLPESRNFLAASYGDYMAIAYQTSNRNGDPTDALGPTMLGLWKVAATTLISQVGTAVQVFPNNVDIAAISMTATSDGELRILLAYSDAMDNTSTDTGTAAPLLHPFRVTADQLAELAPPTALSGAGSAVRIARRPCEPGWLVGYVDPPAASSVLADCEFHLRPVDIDGNIDLEADALWSSGKGRSFEGLGIDEACGATSSRVLVVTGTSDLVATELSWERAAATATVTKSITLLAGSVPFTESAYDGGFWYVTYRSFAGANGVLEADLAHNQVRPVAYPVDPGQFEALDARDVNMYFAPTQSIIAIGSNLIFGFANVKPVAKVDANDKSKVGFETYAITYPLRCGP